MSTEPTSAANAQGWQKTACIFCSLNCGLEVRTEGRAITEVRGDPDHPGSQGYVCEKARRITAYQSAADRITTPLRRRPDGSFEPVSWDTAIREVADRLASIRERHGGEKILFYGGGGQGNHLGGTYCESTLKALGVRYRSNALAQEKSGEFWVNGKMLGAGVHGDFEHAEVGLFLGKNPWHSHGFARARAVINAFKKDPNRTLIVVDPRRSETAARADIHLQLEPGTDAWCLAALVAILVQEDLVAHDWVAAHADGFDRVAPLFADIDVPAYAAICNVPEELLRRTARRIAAAQSVATFEDLGLQMNQHSTLASYLHRLVWMLTGHFGKQGSNNAFVPFLSLSAASKGNVAGKSAERRRRQRVSPVTGSKIVIGLIPCNVMAEEILADHPERFRAMIIQSGNPVHSIADSPRMREAMAALEFSVVLDVAMTETARCADYVLPAASQFEKAECTFFNIEFPRNTFHLRRALFDPAPGTLPEAEIHSRLVERLAGITDRHLRPLRIAARLGRPALAAALALLLRKRPDWFGFLPVLLYRALGPCLPAGTREAAALWPVCHAYLRAERSSAARAGYTGFALRAAERLFDDVLSGRGIVFSESEYDETWDRVRTPGGRFQLALPELFDSVTALADGAPAPDPDYPLVLSAGERRSSTTNTILRDPTVRPRGAELRISPADASSHGVETGDRVRLSTRRGSVIVDVDVTDTMRAGHVSLPNGFGLAFEPGGMAGVPTNELTSADHRDPFVGTPWHKHVPARIEACPAEAARSQAEA
ncbi:MAG: molybdopterin-dependent oxidoreductase [Acidobacteriota bacterium]